MSLSGVQSEYSPGFPLKACGNDGLWEGGNSAQQAERNSTHLDSIISEALFTEPLTGAAAAQTPSINCSMRFRIAASGKRPRAAPILSTTYSALAMPGTAQVTAG